ncbi:MAG: YbjQ family protein [Polyangiaceae bacterium]
MQDPKQALVAAAQPYAIEPSHELTASRVTTSFVLEGFRILQTLGVVRGIVVRSRSMFGQIGAGFQMMFGGNITILTELAERAREDSFRIMLEHARLRGANAVVGMRYDATEMMGGAATEVLCYGTAVVVEPVASGYREAHGG